MWGLRLWPSIAGAVMVVLAALIARELGGGMEARILAAIGAATSLVLLGANWLFQTITFDEFVWLACLLIVARLLRTGTLLRPGCLTSIQESQLAITGQPK